MSGTKVDLETLRAAVKEYESIRDDLIQAKTTGQALIAVKGAGRDVPSQVYANWAVNAGAMHQQSNQQLQDTLTTRIDNLKATLAQYEQTEQGNQANFKP
ncbi:PE domain-containing protein [Lentzea sp. CC55]|uniref:PE domain-containing protein n=1 Tax=Lentzea sp. CC55 TaxID=2884909 RepID=UPI001F25770C|nr:PE domain-containing protein [Lentzea sp. CC55]MCG8926242.1 PE domain-containing protein [Lentzea sp. CC55]